MSNPRAQHVPSPLRVRLVSGFQRFSRHFVVVTGHPMAFGVAMLMILLWLLTGPMFSFSDTWQLVINTVANIITFLMIFLIRNAQNRESEAMQIKLDELIRATTHARNSLLDIEKLTEEELDLIRSRFERLAQKARHELSSATVAAIDPVDARVG